MKKVLSNVFPGSIGVGIGVAICPNSTPFYVAVLAGIGMGFIVGGIYEILKRRMASN